MNSYKFHIAPRDLLFLRDARPMQASDAGLGGNWPRPDQIWHAFISAFHYRWLTPQTWEHQHRKNKDDKLDSSDRFGALKSAGPFPVDEKAGKIYFPCPLDLSNNTDGMLYPMQLIPATAGTNLPAGLKYAFASVVIGKNEPSLWIDGDLYAKYLEGKCFAPGKVDLYDKERNIGIAIDPETKTTEDRKLYQAEYLRFRADTRMAVQVSCNITGANRQLIDVFKHIAIEENIPLILGGQQGVANVYRHDFALPENHLAVNNDSLLLRWTLLSPAVFPEIKASQDKGIKHHPGGWLPNWIDSNTMQVMLPSRPVERHQVDESREQWRLRTSEAAKFSAKLVAARIGKPFSFSGWDLQNGPKPTIMAVPAGSVYIFECNSAEELKQLAAALAWNGGSGSEIVNRRSALLGEKGFGLGVCSIYNNNNSGNQ